MVLKFCANLSFMFTEKTDNLLERYQLASQAGFKAVEFTFPYQYNVEDVVKAKSAANVDQILINAYPGDLERGELGLAIMSGRQNEFRESLEKTMEYAAALDCKKIHIMAGKKFSGIVDTAMDDVYKDNLEYAAKVFKEKGFVGLIEPISEVVIPHYFMNSVSKALQLVKEINSDSLKLQLDIFHLQLIEGNLTNRIKELLPYIGHIQISQAPTRDSPDSEGEINYRYILKLLEDLGYEGFIGLEYKPTKASADSIGWIKEWGYSL
ncbi:putative hydroxypyruvate isomerase [Daphnia pulex]|uniref:putative hydroxypyruvate isomerase n=1 Tax=Daphnia pulex TaxID=6669 RepID=UPI001EDE7632|nr:putative hydroxypyruvate isomerase [Daphnia pulex]